MRILGIDPGLARVGYGVIDTTGGQQRMLDCGIIRTDPGQPDGERMVEIAGDLRQLIRRWRPELAAVEKFFLAEESTLQVSAVHPSTFSHLRQPLTFLPQRSVVAPCVGGAWTAEAVGSASMAAALSGLPSYPDGWEGKGEPN